MALVGAAAAHAGARLPRGRGVLVATVVANMAVVALFGLTDHLWGRVALFLTHVALQTVVGIRVYGLFQSRVRDETRATSTSLSSMGDSLLSSAGAWATGLLMASAGAGAAMVVSLVLYALLLLLVAAVRR